MGMVASSSVFFALTASVEEEGDVGEVVCEVDVGEMEVREVGEVIELELE